MSITFHIKDDPLRIKDSPCLCSQMAPTWGSAYRGEIPLAKANLGDFADPMCPYCGGRGWERDAFDGHLWPACYLSNDTAAAILSVLGVRRRAVGSLYGQALDDAIAACRAALPETNAPVRAVAVRPGRGSKRVIEIGLDDEGVRDRLRRLLNVLTTAKSMGLAVVWS